MAPVPLESQTSNAHLHNDLKALLLVKKFPFVVSCAMLFFNGKCASKPQERNNWYKEKD
jgi:hypothetical protein